MILTSLTGIPLVQPGDNIAEFVQDELRRLQIKLETGDIFVIAQKIVSKSEGRLVNLTQVTPSREAIDLAGRVQKDARFVELVLRESQSVLRTRPGTLIVEHKLGFVCANAGIDHSNVQGLWGNPDDWVLLLPENPDLSANLIRKELEKADNVFVMCADVDWSDLGTWSSLYEHSVMDKDNNAIINGTVFSYENSGNIINISPGKVAVLQGLKDYIVVNSDDILLIVKKEEEQNIKKYLDAVKKKTKEKYYK